MIEKYFQMSEKYFKQSVEMLSILLQNNALESPKSFQFSQLMINSFPFNSQKVN